MRANHDLHATEVFLSPIAAVVMQELAIKWVIATHEPAER